MKRRIYGLETEFGIIWTPDVAHRKTLTVQNVQVIVDFTITNASKRIAQEILVKRGL